jgi:hypothetical protein
MPVTPSLLRAAHEAEVRLADAEHGVVVARAEFHRTVRHLSLAGGSLREIGTALGLSHQRVHQIVEAANHGRAWGAVGGPDEVVRCSWCGRDPTATSRLIRGFQAYVCDQCVSVAERVIRSGRPETTATETVDAVKEEQWRARCSFCGKRRGQVERWRRRPTH